MQIFLFAALVGAITVAVPVYADDVAVITTEQGAITIEFFPADAPLHVDNFVNLANDGFYDDTIFHRIIPGFMIQGGDPLTKQGEVTMNRWGTGGPDASVPAEFNDIKHLRGIVSMARSANPDSAGSQFFIVDADSAFLDGQYTVFGRIITEESHATLSKIAALPTDSSDRPVEWEGAKITSVDIVDRSTIPDAMDLDPPERAGSAAPPIPDIITGDQPYTVDELNVTFLALDGWRVLQNPDGDGPNIVMMRADDLLTSITIAIHEKDGRTADQYVAEQDAFLESAAQLGTLEVTGRDYGDSRYAVNASQGFQGIEVLFSTIAVLGDRFYIVTLGTDGANHNELYSDFVRVADSIGPSSDAGDDEVSSLTGADPDSPRLVPPETGGCLIATAAFGTEMAPMVQTLREVRDDTVLRTASGAAFMDGFNQFYYAFSPAVADLERQNPAFRDTVKITLTPMIWTLGILPHLEIDSEAEMIGYGLGLILLNLGMYVATPALTARQLYKMARQSVGSIN